MMRTTGRLYAFDVSEKRLAKLKPRMARAGLSNVHPVLIAHEADAKVKRPGGQGRPRAGRCALHRAGARCAATPTSRRQSPAAVEEMVAKQGAILAAAARVVRPGGRLVYATCSLLAEENDGISRRLPRCASSNFARCRRRRCWRPRAWRWRPANACACCRIVHRHRWLLRRGDGARQGCVSGVVAPRALLGGWSGLPSSRCRRSLGVQASELRRARARSNLPRAARRHPEKVGDQPDSQRAQDAGGACLRLHQQRHRRCDGGGAAARVRVEVLADAQMNRREKGNAISRLFAAGVPVAFETRYNAAHNKVLIVDAEGPALRGAHRLLLTSPGRPTTATPRTS